MELQVIFVFTHDSIGVGEDGPTHEPIEHLASLRAIPHLDCDSPRRRERGGRGLAHRHDAYAGPGTARALAAEGADARSYEDWRPRAARDAAAT